MCRGSRLGQYQMILVDPGDEDEKKKSTEESNEEDEKKGQSEERFNYNDCKDNMNVVLREDLKAVFGKFGTVKTLVEELLVPHLQLVGFCISNVVVTELLPSFIIHICLDREILYTSISPESNTYFLPLMC